MHTTTLLLITGALAVAITVSGQSNQQPIQPQNQPGACAELNRWTPPTKLQLWYEKMRVKAEAKTGIHIETYAEMKADLVKRCAAEKLAAAQAQAAAAKAAAK